MKLVISAATPLSLDEIRVALCVVLGERVWHPEKMVKDGTQLISLCGGNLLELDEEDGKVRFIHHSVMQHLHSPANSQSTIPYHFTVEDAENFIGAVCVTYLHLPVLDSRITGTRTFQSLGMVDNVVGTTENSLPGVNRLIQHIRSREQRRGRLSQIDIGHILAQIQAARIKEDLDPRCFVDYATSHWVSHTKYFNNSVRECRETWELWWRLLRGEVASVKSPFEGFEDEIQRVLWAISHEHESLFRVLIVLYNLGTGHTAVIAQALKSRKNIRGQWLGLVLAQYLLTFSAIEMSLAALKIFILLGAGADPWATHSMLESSPIDILTHRICTDTLDRDEELRLVFAFFSHPKVQRASKDVYVLDFLKKLLGYQKFAVIAEILACRPDLRREFHKIRATRIFGRPSSLWALTRRKRNLLALLF